MSRKTVLETAAVLAVILGLTIVIYNLPPVHDRFAWRVELVVTYLRGMASPVRAMPSPVPQSTQEVAELNQPQVPTPTHAPTRTPLPTRPGPTATPLPTPTPIPGSVSLPSPEYELQDWNNCGPATLTMYLRYYGWEGDQFDISEVVKPLREDRNVNVEELQYYVRNHAGWLNFEFRVGGDVEILKKFLAAGIPVMIEEGTALDQSYWPRDDRWAGHYLLVTGYNDSTGKFSVIDSYHKEIKTNTYEQVIDNWQAFNYVYMLVYRPEQELAVQSILGEEWDMDTNRQRALEESQAATESDPDNPYNWFNLGSNLVYFERYAEAAHAYDTARSLSLPQRMLLYQFGPYFAYFHSIRNDDLMAVTDYILKLPSHPDSEEAYLWHGWGLFRQGDRLGALENFQAALEANPNYSDAQYALNYLGTNP